MNQLNYEVESSQSRDIMSDMSDTSNMSDDTANSIHPEIHADSVDDTSDVTIVTMHMNQEQLLAFKALNIQTLSTLYEEEEAGIDIEDSDLDASTDSATDSDSDDEDLNSLDGFIVPDDTDSDYSDSESDSESESDSDSDTESDEMET